jgi:hypothetical protein
VQPCASFAEHAFVRQRLRHVVADMGDQLLANFATKVSGLRRIPSADRRPKLDGAGIRVDHLKIDRRTAPKPRRGLGGCVPSIMQCSISRFAADSPANNKGRCSARGRFRSSTEIPDAGGNSASLDFKPDRKLSTVRLE